MSVLLSIGLHCNWLSLHIYSSIFARKTLEATDLKVGMNIQLHSVSHMGWVPTGHTTYFSCVRLNKPKMVYQQKH